MGKEWGNRVVFAKEQCFQFGVKAVLIFCPSHKTYHCFIPTSIVGFL